MRRYPFVTIDTVENCLDTLAYLRKEFIDYGKIDMINMAHVERALALVEADRRKSWNTDLSLPFADPFKIAAE